MNLRIVKDVARTFGEDKVPRLASSMAFCVIFSIAPLIIVVIAIVGAVLGFSHGSHGHHLTEDAFINQVRHAVGAQSAEAIRQLVGASFNKPRQNLIAQVIGWSTFFLGAAALFSALQDSLNTIWRVEAKSNLRRLLRARAASFAMLLVIVALFLAAFITNAALALIATHFPSSLPLSQPFLLSAASQGVTFVVATLAFAGIYKILPDTNVAWREVWLGAFVTALLFVPGQTAIGYYFAIVGTTSAYGAAGSLLAVLLWIYYSTLILLIGAEFTKAFADDARVDTESSSSATAILV